MQGTEEAKKPEARAKVDPAEFESEIKFFD
jgi:hypothetical protein